MDVLDEIAAEALLPGTEIYSLRLLNAGGGYHIEVQLDDLNHPTGSVNLEQCEAFSRLLVERLDRALESGQSALPADLNAENYSLEVSSAGAERGLRLPEDLERFKSQPVKLQFDLDEKVYTEVVTYRGREERDGREILLFESYKTGGSRKKGAKMQKKAQLRTYELSPSQIRKGNLYLDK
jgi:ribosome maturation factor RimP